MGVRRYEVCHRRQRSKQAEQTESRDSLPTSPSSSICLTKAVTRLCCLFVEAEVQLQGNEAAYLMISEWAQSKYVTLISSSDG